MPNTTLLYNNFLSFHIGLSPPPIFWMGGAGVPLSSPPKKKILYPYEFKTKKGPEIAHI